MFVFLSKKVALPSDNFQLSSIGWNKEEGWIACGGREGLLKVIRLDQPVAPAPGQAPQSNLSMNQTLEGHKSTVSVITWNDAYRKLTTSDADGLIIVWVLHRQMWYEEMINNRNKSVVADMKWSADGQKICIAYEDGAVIVGSVEGNRIWGTELEFELGHIEWAPDGRTILFSSKKGEVFIYDNQGNQLNTIAIKCMREYRGNIKEVSCIHWFSRGSKALAMDEFADPSLCIAYKCGHMQLMRFENDENPVLIDTQMTVTKVEWNNTGSILAVSGSSAKLGGVVQFYTCHGVHMRTLTIPDALMVSSVSWEGNGLRLSLAVGSLIYFANIKPDYKWAYFNNTIVYAYNKLDRGDFCVVFWNTTTDEKYLKFMKKLVSISAAGEHCVITVKAEESLNRWNLILCNAIGSPVDSKTINIEPMFMSMNSTHVVVCSEETVYVWQYRSQVSKVLSLDQSKRKGGREIAFHIDEQPDFNSLYDPSRYNNQRPTSEKISCVHANDGFFLVGRISGQVHKYTIPHISIEKRYMLSCRPGMINANIGASKFSIIDIHGTLTFYDVQGGTMLDIERRDVWDMKWSADNPELIVIMEKTRMYVFLGYDVEEPVVSSGYLCEFKDLEIKAVLLDEIFKAPEDAGKVDELVIKFETRTLKDTREMVRSLDVKDAFEHVEKNPYPRLWRIVAEAALLKLDFDVAHKGFVKCNDYKSIRFVNRVRKIDDPLKQKAEVAIYFENFDEAEDIYKQIDRKDLALDMRVKIGDWLKVLHYIDQGVGNDELIQLSYNNIANFYAEKGNWKKAAAHYALAQNNEELIESYYRLEDFESLGRMIEVLPEGSPLLMELGEKFQSVGLCEEAVQAYIKAGDTRAAVDCCVLLNQWNQAVELAETHHFVQIEGLLSKYANLLLEEKKTVEAIQLYRKANRNTEAAKILINIAKDISKTQVPPLVVKKIYVMAALEVDSYKKRVLEAQITGTGTTAQTLDSLITSDINTMSDKSIDNPWRGAEAYHFYLLAQRQLYEREYLAALMTSLRLSEYENVLETKTIYSLVALSAYYAGFLHQCSKAMVKLENLPGQSDEDREAYEELSVSLFKNGARDPPIASVNCPGKGCTFKVNSLMTNCPECGSNFPACMVSGAPVLEKNYVQCKSCKHKAIESELRKANLKNCPICHAAMRIRNK